jgi:hypothetical protein
MGKADQAPRDQVPGGGKDAWQQFVEKELKSGHTIIFTHAAVSTMPPPGAQGGPAGGVSGAGR